MNGSDSIVIIPTYNEKENIEKIIRAVFSLEKCFHILVIDDGSPDGTAAIVHRLIGSEFGGRLHIIERQGKQGLGTAYIAGFKWAQVGAGQRIRLHLRDGRRLQPRPQRPAAALRRLP